MKHPIIAILVLSVWISSCKNEKAVDNIAESRINTEASINEVKVMYLKEQDFQKEIVSNGKLEALQKAELTFEVGERILKKNYKNGDAVQKGAIIASLNKEALMNQLNQAQIRYDKAKLDLEDILIGQGYEMKNTAAIPDELLATAKLLSGYASALSELENTKLSIKKSDLHAPFSGIVSGIEHNVYDRIGASEVYCTLIDQSKFLVSFDVLESEIGEIKTGKEIEAAPFSTEKFEYMGTVYEINPVVDKHGLIKVGALIESTRGLMEGMNMKVRVRTSVPGKLVVPKTAVLIRQNKDILFKYTGDGKAVWTYIIKELENSTSYAVTLQPNSVGSLQAGDTIIVSGNRNLAHESDVVIVD